MPLHSAGHRRGVVCAPHAAVGEDGRAIHAEGGNAIEAMIAMAASIATGDYSYLRSEVLDADASEAFEETGNVFDPATAQRLRDFIYGAGNLCDPAETYNAFRGRLPAVDALLKKRGLDRAAAEPVHS